MIRSTLLMTLAIVACLTATQARADTTVFEDGFWLIFGPAEYDDVVVGQGAIVGFTGGVIIHGNLEIEDGAWCSFDTSLCEGHVKARGATIVDLSNSVIDGKVDVQGTGGPAVLGLLPLISIVNCNIDGNVKIQNNDVNFIDVIDNVIHGQLQLKRNTYNRQNVSGNTFSHGKCDRKS